MLPQCLTLQWAIMMPTAFRDSLRGRAPRLVILCRAAMYAALVVSFMMFLAWYAVRGASPAAYCLPALVITAVALLLALLCVAVLAYGLGHEAGGPLREMLPVVTFGLFAIIFEAGLLLGF